MFTQMVTVKLTAALKMFVSLIVYVLPLVKEPMIVAIPVERGCNIVFPSCSVAIVLSTYACVISTSLFAVFLT